MLENRQVKGSDSGTFVDEPHRPADVGRGGVDGLGEDAVGLGQQKSGEKGVGCEQALPRGGNGLHQILKGHGKVCLGLGGLGVHMQAQSLHNDQVSAVQVAAAPVGHGVAKALSHRPAWLIGRQLQSLGVHGKFLAAVLFGQTAASLGQLIADAPAMGDVLKNLRQIVGFSEFQAVIPQPLFVCLHGPGDGVGGGDGVHAQLVQLIVPVQNFPQVIVADIAAQQAQSFQLGAFYVLTLNLNGSGAADGAGQAALVGDVVFLCQRLAAHLVEVLKLTLGVVFCGQNPQHLHGADQPRGAQPGQLLPGQGVVLEVCNPLFTPLRCLFRIVDGDGFGAAGGDSL